MRSLFIFILLSALGPTAFAQEGNLLIPMDFENAKVLPKGIRNFRLRGAQFQATEKHDGTGAIVPVGNALNKGVTWNKVISGKDTDTERGILKGYLESKNVNLNEELGQTTGVVGIDFQTTIPIFAWGITDKMTLAVAVPVVRTSLSVDSGFVANDNLKNAGNSLIQDGSQNKAYELQYKTANAISEKLKKYNYDALESSEETRIGDIRIVGKNLVHQKGRFDVAIKSMLTVPTGEPTKVNRAVDIGSGDGQWDVGLGVATDWNYTESNVFSAYVAGIAQLPNSMSRRIPEENDSKLSPDVDNNTKMDLGDVVNFQIGNKYSFLKGMSLTTAYTLQYKGRDKYSGSKFGSQRYNWLEKDTAQSMETVHVALGYSTIQLFREKKFPAPIEANVGLNRVVGGRNAINDYLVSFELAAYF
jgi:hypothetical protein